MVVTRVRATVFSEFLIQKKFGVVVLLVELVEFRAHLRHHRLGKVVALRWERRHSYTKVAHFVGQVWEVGLFRNGELKRGHQFGQRHGHKVECVFENCAADILFHLKPII